jgi:hypothetical protein
MPSLFAQSGLFQMAIIAMFVIYGLPLFAVISLIAAILTRLLMGLMGRSFELRQAASVFIKTFGVLSLGGAAVVMAACIWAQFAIDAR